MSHPDIRAAGAADFADVVLAASARQPVLVDFWAAWCAPCRALAPLLEQLEERHRGRLRVVKVDTDAESDLAARYGVRSLPTLLLFRDGGPVQQVVGAQPLAALERLVEPWLPRPADELLVAAAAAVPAEAVVLLERALALDPADYRVHPRLAALYLDLARNDDARALIDGLPANVAVEDAVRALVARLNLVTDADAADADDDPLAAAFAAARAAAARGDYDTAVPALLDLLARDRQWRDGLLRTTLIDIFSVLGGDPRVRPWRAQLARTLN